MKLRYAMAFLPLGLAACDEQAMQDIRMPWDKPEEVVPAAPVDPMSTPLVAPAVSPNDVPVEVEGERAQVATAEARTLNATAFVARGNEPFWRVDVAGGTAKYQTPENQSGSNVAVNRIVYRQGVEYIGEWGGAAFSLNIRHFDSFEQYRAQYPLRTLFPFMLTGAVPLEEAVQKVDGPFSLVFGNEASGLPDEFAQLGVSTLIPHSHQIDSLNLAIAAGIGMYAFTRK